MGLLDEALSKAIPGGQLSKPLMIALGALLVGKMMGGGSTAQTSEPSLVPQAGNAGVPDGGLLGGVGGLVEKLKSAGHGDTVSSWVGTGQNKPIDPGQLGSALGPKTVSAAAQQSGVNDQQLLQQLAQALPGVVDKLTANGRIPTLQELAAAFTQKPPGV
jgi:uncharacterized protein YidB (DUF937 family)